MESIKKGLNVCLLFIMTSGQCILIDYLQVQAAMLGQLLLEVFAKRKYFLYRVLHNSCRFFAHPTFNYVNKLVILYLCLSEPVLLGTISLHNGMHTGNAGSLIGNGSFIWIVLIHRCVQRGGFWRQNYTYIYIYIYIYIYHTLHRGKFLTAPGKMRKQVGR